MSPRDEGYIKFESAHRDCELPARRFGELACKLVAWREIMALTGLVGQDPRRYEGAGAVQPSSTQWETTCLK